mmetsp:Transcript_49264/g.119447  ORF Transcript_49264/g.119447 Transcript_49264/m.119447 type:complete len:208 (+) Transcript_49264:1705-2328(+)
MRSRMCAWHMRASSSISLGVSKLSASQSTVSATICAHSIPASPPPPCASLASSAWAYMKSSRAMRVPVRLDFIEAIGEVAWPKPRMGEDTLVSRPRRVMGDSAFVEYLREVSLCKGDSAFIEYLRDDSLCIGDSAFKENLREVSLCANGEMFEYTEDERFVCICPDFHDSGELFCLNPCRIDPAMGLTMSPSSSSSSCSSHPNAPLT